MKMAQMNPELFCADVTHGTNREKRDLFTFAGKTAFGNAFCGAKAFLPSQRRWVFRWIFHTALPVVLGEATIKRVRLLMTDGDTDEYIPLLDLIATSDLWKNAKHGLCEWHLLFQQWVKQVSPHVPDTEKAKLVGEEQPCCLQC